MSKASHLNFLLNTHFFVTNISSANPHFFVRHFHCCLTGNTFGTSNNPMCHIFLILSYVYIFLSESYLSLILFFLASVQSLSHWQCLLPHPTHHHKRHLSTAYTPTTQQNNTSHIQLLSPLCCPPAAPLLPATSLTSRLMLAARHPMLVLAIAA
jgi:hypothetical protein